MTTANISSSQFFEAEIPLPDDYLMRRTRRLVGFQERYKRLQRELRLLIESEGIVAWSTRFYGRRVPLIDVAADRYPLVVFYGDAGTGKTATAEALGNELTRELGKEGMLFKLSTRVRGAGHVGQMSMFINQAFEVVVKEAGKTKLAFLIIDEADSFAATRETEQSHHEDKVAVNTLIQKIDDVRRLGGRVLVFLCTNRYAALDPAILRRAGRIEQFDRPDAEQREELIRLDCEGLGLSDALIEELVELTGADGVARPVGFTFSDLRTRLFPEALARAYPDRQLAVEDLLEVARAMRPTPPMGGTM
jgi:SpoVK/Ycf46/Vps4 family AAA+-type ATPase